MGRELVMHKGEREGVEGGTEVASTAAIGQ